MYNPVRTIRLYGVLGSKFGRVHKLAVKSPAEAIRALSALLPGFETFMMNAKGKGLTFSVFVGKSDINEDQLQHPSGNDDIRIAPVIVGSKRAGVFQTILGAVLVVVGFAIAGWSWGTAGPFAQGLIMMGASMILGGVIQMLSPQPKGLGASDDDKRTSYSFNGAVNTHAQGNPVPLLYGRLIVGSAVISAGIISNELYAPVGGNNCNIDPKGWSRMVSYALCQPIDDSDNTRPRGDGGGGGGGSHHHYEHEPIS